MMSVLSKPNEFREMNDLITSVSLLIPDVERKIIKEAIFILRNIYSFWSSVNFD